MGEGGSGSKGSGMLRTHGPTFKNDGEYLLAGATRYYVALVNMFLSIPKEGSRTPPTNEGGKLLLYPHEIARLQTYAKRDGAPPPHPPICPSRLFWIAELWPVQLTR